MMFGFIICVYVGILVLAMLARGRHSAVDRYDDPVDELFEVETQPGPYDGVIELRERILKEDLATDGKMHGTI